ncbi:MAG: hypothetical protein H6970_08290 [Gammaproteobacteria bacterium]|nr:hypothetical protein [Gammaproteobacteria bacterium]MCP5425052.1 hypothetical protein [Gammaproteobacteria bacterium]MCP5459755.1 hypothetical protein [Gammaproteobacteria bacterium]
MHRGQPLPSLTPEGLCRENHHYRGTGGVSCNNRRAGFRSAFLDSATGRVYLSRFANGQPAPIHILDGLPDDLVVRRSAEGRITAVKQTLIAGFLAAGVFYTREQAAQIMASL